MVVVKGCYSHRVIKSYVPRTLTGLLTDGLHGKNFSSFASLWLSTHLCTHLVYKAVSNILRICLVLQKKPREMHY